jgi:copper homeostasis protein (lipoprotein)
MKQIVALAMIFMLITSHFFCSSPSYNVASKTKIAGNNGRNSLDWDGIYRGVMPCADCGGIRTTIELNKDMTYTIKFKYIGKPDSVTERTGNFEWIDKGNTIILRDPQNSNRTISYHVGEDLLQLIDANGNAVKGKTPDSYTLSKANYAILDRYWKLTELNGQSIVSDSGFNRQPQIIFKENDNRIIGNGGCNDISGTFEIGNADHIAFSNMVSTRMSCPNSSLETKFLKVLNKVDNYFANEDELVLGKTKTTPLAKFKAVETKE